MAGLKGYEAPPRLNAVNRKQFQRKQFQRKQFQRKQF